MSHFYSELKPKVLKRESYLERIRTEAKSILENRSDETIKDMIPFIHGMIDRYEVEDVSAYLNAACNIEEELTAQEINEMGMADIVAKNCFSRKYGTWANVLEACLDDLLDPDDEESLTYDQDFPEGKAEETPRQQQDTSLALLPSSYANNKSGTPFLSGRNL